MTEQPRRILYMGPYHDTDFVKRIMAQADAILNIDMAEAERLLAAWRAANPGIADMHYNAGKSLVEFKTLMDRLNVEVKPVHPKEDKTIIRGQGWSRPRPKGGY